MHVANIGLDRITKAREDSAKLSIVMEIYMVMYCIAINSCTIRVRVQCTFFQPRVAIDELPRRKNERMLF